MTRRHAAVCAAALLLTATEARADVAPTPVTVPFLLFFFVVPVLAILARLLLIGIGRLVSRARPAPAAADGARGSPDAAPRAPQLGFRVRNWLVVLALGTAACVYADYGQYRSFSRRNRMRFEARNHLQSIRSLEVAHFAEWGVYVPCAPSPPGGGTDVEPDGWSDAGGFSVIGFAPEGRVVYRYEVAVGPDGKSFTATARAPGRDGKPLVLSVGHESTEVRLREGQRWL